jgi:superfamily I DNA and/or RNA helicase
MPSDKANRAEAEVVARLLQQVYEEYGDRFNIISTVGVIVPYRNQITMIRRAIEALNQPLLMDISIDTVERYQGSQREVIIYDLGVSRLYQLDFLTASTFIDDEGQTIDRKLNVALTRARRQMILVGRPAILRQNPLYRQLIDKFSVKL